MLRAVLMVTCFAFLACDLDRRVVRAETPRARAATAQPSPIEGPLMVPRARQQAAAAPVETSPSRTTATRSVFDSREVCEDLVRNGQRLFHGPNTARFGAYNIRWFPDGVPGSTPKPSRAIDVPWLACVLAWLGLDAVALAEIKPRARSEAALGVLVSTLDAWTGGRHRVFLDDCPESNGQHVGWLIDETRVKASYPTTHATLNPHEEACAGQLRPGFGLDLKFSGGLDLHAIAVHLKSGTAPRDGELRRRTIEALPGVVESVITRSGDFDVLVAGDFNTMGCRSCREPVGALGEASSLDGYLARHPRPLRRVGSDLGCSHFYQGRPSLLDHFLITTSTKEAEPQSLTRVEGECRRAWCESVSRTPTEAQKHLSDHCPIVLELADRDDDQ